MRQAPLIALALALLGAAPAPAAGLRDRHPLPMLLPGDASAAGTATVRASWIVGALPGRSAQTLARRHGARPIGPHGGYELPRGRAPAFAAALRRRGLLHYAQPNTPLARAATGTDPLSPQAGWRDYVADPALNAPAVTAESPLIAIIDSPIAAHPEFQGGNVSSDGAAAPYDLHGTAVAGAAAAPVNGVGIVGIWPGARLVGIPMPQEAGCADSARGIARAIELRAAVVNMSYGGGRCAPEEIAIQYLVGAGGIPVAAAGNEFAEGNPPEFPATYAHVLTAAAIDASGERAGFSNTNDAIDVAAPGRSVLLPVPPAVDPDGDGDGYAFLDGTSFSAPMVSAAAAWVTQVRDTLRPDQVQELVRRETIDLLDEGYDAQTGFGLVRVDRALRARTPFGNPSEPNDDIEWVDGTRFKRADKTVRTVRALVDSIEDAVDVYRIRVRGRGRARVSLDPSFGDPDLFVYSRSARSVFSARAKHRSTRSGSATDRVTVRNGSRSARTFYVVVGFTGGGDRAEEAKYTLRVR